MKKKGKKKPILLPWSKFKKEMVLAWPLEFETHFKAVNFNLPKNWATRSGCHKLTEVEQKVASKYFKQK